MDYLLLVIYLIYGLAFFAMGIVAALSAGFTPSQGRMLRPLALFGFLHGFHELLEIFLLQATWLGAPLPDWTGWGRVSLLALSFLALLVYGILAYKTGRPHFGRADRIATLALLAYVAIVLISAWSTYHGRANIPWQQLSDALARYLLAVPSCFLAAMGLAVWSRDSDPPLARPLYYAAMGFALYGFTQLVVPKVDMVPATLLNASAFRSWTGIPIQALRALLAIAITLALLRASQIAEEECRTRALKALEEHDQARRDLLLHTVRAQEDERARIARELHDEISQLLAALSLDAGTLQQGLPARSRLRPLADRLQFNSRRVAEALYRITRDLRPAQLDELGLVPALKFLTMQEFRAKNLKVDLKIEGEARRLDPLSELVLFRVTQEACNNVLRHARTDQAWIRLSFEPEQVQLEIEDHGAGFDPRQIFRPPRGWGLAGMRERLEALNGHLELTSSPGQGTRVTATIPLARTKEK